MNCHRIVTIPPSGAFYASGVWLPFSFRSSVDKFMVDLEHIGNIFSSEKDFGNSGLQLVTGGLISPKI